MKGQSRRVGRWIGQAILYGAFAAFLGLLSDWPVYEPHDPSQALIKLSLTHPGKRKDECRRRSREELAELPPNMRAPLSCSRERWPVLVELDLDDKTIFARTVNPVGLSADGQSSFYHTFAVPAGRHRIAVRMRDRGDGQGFDYAREAWVTLAPAQSLVVSFSEDEGRFFLQ